MNEFDELGALRSFRADVGELTPKADVRIRARIHAALGDVATFGALDQSRKGEPDRVGDDDVHLPGSDAQVVDLRGHSRFAMAPADGSELSAIDDSPLRTDDAAAAVIGMRPAKRPSPNRGVRWLAAAAAVVVIVAAGLAVAGRGRSAPEPGLVTSAASAVDVTTLAAIQRAQPARTLGPGQYQYTNREVGERRDDLGMAAARGPQFVVRTRQQWIDTRGTGRDLSGPAQARPVGDPGAPAVVVERGADMAYSGGTKAFAGFSYHDLMALPTDGAGLRQRLVTSDIGLAPERTGIVKEAGALLQFPVTPPAVRGAVIDMLAQEGLRGVGDRTDRSGRTGAGFELDAGDTRWTFIFDRSTGRLLTWEQRNRVTGVLYSDSLTLDSLIPSITDTTEGS